MSICTLLLWCHTKSFVSISNLLYSINHFISDIHHVHIVEVYFHPIYPMHFFDIYNMILRIHLHKKINPILGCHPSIPPKKKKGKCPQPQKRNDLSNLHFPRFAMSTHTQKIDLQYLKNIIIIIHISLSICLMRRFSICNCNNTWH